MLFPVIAAGHAVNIDGALIAWNLDFRIQFERLATFVILARFRIELVDLAQHHRATVLLAHLHGIALHRRPELMERIIVHRASHFEPVLGLAPMFLLEFRQYAPFVSQLVPWPESTGHKFVEIGKKVETRNFIMRSHR